MPRRVGVGVLFAALMPLISVALSGCVIYQGVAPPSLPAAADGAPALRCGDKQIIYSYKHNGTDNPGFTNQTYKRLERVIVGAIAESKLVSPSASPGRLLKLRVVNDERSNYFVTALSQATLFLFPLWGENVFTVTGQVIEGSEVVKTAEASASVKLFGQLFLIFALPFNNYSIADETLAALMRNVCAELSRT